MLNRIKSITGICLTGMIMAGFLCVLASMFAKNVLFDVFHINNPTIEFLTRNMEELTENKEADREQPKQPEIMEEQSKQLSTGEQQEEQTTPEELEKSEEKAEEFAWGEGIKGKVNRYQEKVDFLKERVTWYSQDWFLLRHEMLYGAAVYDRTIDWWLPDFSDDNDIIRMNNGHFTYVLQKKDQAAIEMFGNGISELARAVWEEGGSFLYVNVPSKSCRYDRQLSAGIPEYSIENGENLLAYLKEQKVDTLDLRDKLHEAGINHYDAFFKGDLHWKPETGFWAAGVLAETLNHNYGFAFGEECFLPENYKFLFFEKCYEGGITYKITPAKSPYDDYTLILPDFDTQLTVNIPAKGFLKTGEFKDVLANLTYLDQGVWTDPSKCYHSWRWLNDPLGSIVNRQTEHNQGKRLLVLTDSFGWPVVPYLALDVESVDIIYPGSYQGSIIEYVKETQPDMVIYLLAERDIGIRSDY